MPKRPARRAKVGPYRTVFRGKLYTIKQARVLPSRGKPLTYELAEHVPSVVVLALDDRGRLLINHEYRSRQRAYDWRLPAGRVEPGESPRHAAQRELREEAGVRAQKLKLFYVKDGRHSQSLNWPTHIFLASGLQPAPLLRDADEDIRTNRVPLTRAIRMALDGTIKNDLAAYVILKLAYQRGLLKLPR
ncbi:MAG: NUDIX hydrolase [Candidatus Andersenbacteria bacterium]